MIDEALIDLVKAVQQKLKSLKGARPSEIQAARETFADQAKALIETALDDLTADQKISYFDDMAKRRMETLVAEIEARVGDNYCNDSDNEHYESEDANQAVFGPRIYDATNEFERIFTKGRG